MFKTIKIFKPGIFTDKIEILFPQESKFLNMKYI